MIKLCFKINKYYLVYHTFAYGIKNKTNPFPFPEWENLVDRLLLTYKNDPAFYFVFPHHIEWAIKSILLKSDNKILLMEEYKKTQEKISGIYDEIFLSPEFKQLLKQTNDYLIKVENQWNTNKNRVMDFLKDILGPDILRTEVINKSLDVFIVHPNTNTGRYVGSQKIVWGHPEDWENYSTVYLSHEIMHFLTREQNIYNDDLMHAIIELAIDNELRIRLNGKGEYFDIECHKHLKQMEQQIFPDWLDYLNQKDKNILNFYSQLKLKTAH